MEIRFAAPLPDVIRHTGLPPWTSADVLAYYGRLAGHADRLRLGRIEELVETWRTILRASGAGPAEQAVLAAGLRHTHEYVWSTAYDFLKQLVEHDRRFDAIVLDALHDPRWHTRFNVVAGCDDLPPDLRDRILEAGLADRSRRVRIKAADVISRTDLKAYRSALEHLLVGERDPDVARQYTFTLDFLRDGFHVEERGEGRVWLWVRTSEGTRGVHVSADQVPGGLAAVAATVRRDVDAGRRSSSPA